MMHVRRPVLEVQGLSVTFPGEAPGGFGKRAKPFRALDEIDLTLNNGEALGLIGESGSGKTTLGKAIVGLVPISAGTIALEAGNAAADRRGRARKVQMVFQDPYASLHPRQTIGQTLAEPLRIHKAVPADAIEHKVAQLLERVGLVPHHALRYPQHFSGGQRQRIAIARAIAIEPSMIIADEPVSALDVSVQAQILNLLDDLRRERNMAMLFISHDLSVVRHLCQRIAVMYLGRLVEVAPANALTRRPAHPYTTALLSAVPRVHAGNAPVNKPIVLAGDIPSHAAIPSGCPFHTRCWLYDKKGKPAQCRNARPQLAQHEDGRQSACFFPKEAASA